jgi:HD-GYP domain-containing protein (c-di-GMP phosphodiesterase class II)
MASQEDNSGPQFELMEEFFYDLQEAHQHAESTLIDLEHHPQDNSLLNQLFRSVHTVKGNLVYVGLKELTPLLQSVEDVLELVRSHRAPFDTLLSDVVLLALDKTKQWVQAKVEGRRDQMDGPELDKLCQQISRITELAPQDRQQQVQGVIKMLDPQTQLSTQKSIPLTAEKRLVENPLDNEILADHNIEMNEDLLFFQQLAAPLEQRSHYWQGRSARLLQLTLAMNKRAGAPVDPAQMAAAVYVHDIAMAFLPLELLHKTSPLNGEERDLLKAHTQQAFSLISSMKRWDQASFIVLEHHEKQDGSGYPARLHGNYICPGAKILAIADAFDARTHERAYSNQIKRPFIRAILEINRCAGSHFDSQWVEVFNEVARSMQPSQ